MTVSEYLYAVLTFHFDALLFTPLIFIVIGMLTDIIILNHDRYDNPDYIACIMIVVVLMWIALISFMIFLTFKTTLIWSSVTIVSILSILSFCITLIVLYVIDERN